MKKPKTTETKPEERLTNADIAVDGTIPHESVDLKESPEKGVDEVPIPHEEGPKEGDTGDQGTFQDGSWHKDPVLELQESVETEKATKGSVPLPPEGDIGIGVAALQQQPTMRGADDRLVRTEDAIGAVSGEEAAEGIEPSVFLTFAEASKAGKKSALAFLEGVAQRAWDGAVQEGKGIHREKAYEGLHSLEKLGLSAMVQFVIADPYHLPIGAYMEEGSERDLVRNLDGAIRKELGYAQFTYRDTEMS